MGVVVVVVVVMILGRGVRFAEPLHSKHERRIDDPPFDRQHGGARSHTRCQCLAEGPKSIGSQPVGSADQHLIGSVKLVTEQILDGADVVQAGISKALTFEGIRIAHRAPRSKRFTVNHRDHPIDHDARAHLRPGERLKKGARQGESTGFHDDAVEGVSPTQQHVHRGEEIVLNGAAEAAVVEFHQTALDLLIGTEPAAADQIAVKADGAELIDHHGKALAAVG